LTEKEMVQMFRGSGKCIACKKWEAKWCRVENPEEEGEEEAER